MTGRMAAPVIACRINSAWLMLQAESRWANSAYSSSVMRVLTTRLRCGVLYRFMVGRPPFCAWCPLTNRRKTGGKAELFLKKSPHKSVQKSAKSCRCFMLFFCFPAGDSRVWGRHSPTRFPQGQNERKANFGTSVESCSKKLPDCRSLPTATFSGNRNQFFHKRLRAGVLPLFLAKTFPAAWSFPTIRRFRSCVLPAA